MARKNGAGNETRTRDFHLGKVVLYQIKKANKINNLQDSRRLLISGSRS